MATIAEALALGLKLHQRGELPRAESIYREVLARQPRHAEVIRAIDTVIAKSRAAGVPMGLAVGDDPDALAEWIDKGVNWLSIAADFVLLTRRASQLASRLREHKPAKT